jgi:hypothetical protein
VTCGGCAWSHLRGPGKPVLRCLRHAALPGSRTRRRVSADTPACESFTGRGSLDCQACGACCREAYHCVEVGPREPFARLHPGRLLREGSALQLPRPGGRCVCLSGDPGAWSCSAYAERPRSCRDFPVGEESCLEARRRVGLTP